MWAWGIGGLWATAAGGSLPALGGVSVRNVVPTLTSTSAEIYLSMAGAKQHRERHGVYPGSGRGPYVQQGCALGAVLRCTMVLVEGATIVAGEEERPPGP
jgi:hypothetical protein